MSSTKASTNKKIHIPHLLDEREHTPPLGFADERRQSSPTGATDEGRVSPPPRFDASIVLPLARGVSLRALTDDLILPLSLSIGGPASRTPRSDRIAGICRTVPVKNTGPIHIDLIEDLDSENDTIARRRPRTRGSATLGVARKGPKTRVGASVSTRGPRGGAAAGGTTRGGAATGGTARGGAITDGAARGGTATDRAARGGVATDGKARGGGAAVRGCGAAARGGGAAAKGGGAATRSGGAARGDGATAVKGRGGANVSSSNQVKGKRIVTSSETGIEILESKRKRKERDRKP